MSIAAYLNIMIITVEKLETGINIVQSHTHAMAFDGNRTIFKSFI